MTPPTRRRHAANPLQITVSVDANHCHFYAICAQEAPEVFDLSIDGRLRYKSKPAPHLNDKVWNAARLCPAQAIHIQPADVMTIAAIAESSPPPSARRPRWELPFDSEAGETDSSSPL